MVARNTSGLQKAEAVSKRRKWNRTMCGKVPGKGWENNLSRAEELRNSFTSTPGAKIWWQRLADE